MPYVADVLIGPLLHLGVCDSTHWRFRITMIVRTGMSLGQDPKPSCPFVIDSEHSDVTFRDPEWLADLRVESVHPDGPGHHAGYLVWSWPVEVERQATETWVSYRVAVADDWQVNSYLSRVTPIAELQDGRATFDHVCVPRLGALPRFVFHSCSWFSAPDLEEEADDPYEVWDELFRRHVAARTQPLTDQPGGYQLQLGGGDQVYADVLLPQHDLLRRLWERDQQFPVPPDASGRLLEIYMSMYAKRWGAPSVARVLARVPGVFTWDDHEIMDGWGSFPDEFLESEGPDLVWRAARRAFEVVQLGVRATLRYPRFPEPSLPRGLPDFPSRPATNGLPVLPHYLQSLSFREEAAELHVLVLDLRTERSLLRVLAEEGQWADLTTWFDGFQRAVSAPARLGRKRHLVVITSIPIVFLSGAAPEWVLREFVPGSQDYEDDLRDQWESVAHQDERERLVDTLFTTSQDSSCRVTVLTGDVHVGGKASLVSLAPGHQREGEEANEIKQLIASGMVHPSPGWLGQLFERIGRVVQCSERIGQGVRGELEPLTEKSFLFRQNYLEVRFDALEPENPNSMRGRMYARWITADGALQDERITIDP